MATSSELLDVRRVVADYLEHEDLGLAATQWLAFIKLPVQTVDAMAPMKVFRQDNYKPQLESLATNLGRCSLDQSPKSVLEHVSEEQISVLKLCADVLDDAGYHSPDVRLDSAIQEAIGEVVDLYNDLVAADLPPDLLEYCLSRVSDLEAALRNYRLRGLDEVVAVAQRTVGGVLMYERSEDAEPVAASGRSAIGRILGIFPRLGDAAKTANAVGGLAEKASHLQAVGELGGISDYF